MKVGVLGGTFDPIHIAHLVMAEEAREQLGLGQVLFVPAATPPHKLDHAISPIKHRLAMVQAAIADNPYFQLSRVDVDRPGPHYSVDMVALLREQMGPDTEIFFIMGSDSLAELLTWHRPDRLIQLCQLAVMGRPACLANLGQLERLLPGITQRVHCLHMPALDISSTDIRERVREGRSIRYLVPSPVEAYIREHKLYM